jgi:glutathione S-transferase
MLSEMRDPAYARINPRHETPALITEAGLPLTETMAIAAWVEARDVDRRISFDPANPEADRMHQLMGFLNTGFTGAFTPHWAALEMEPPEPEMQAHLRRFGQAAVIGRHDRLEEMIGTRPYLAGDHPTLADALLVGVARWLDFHEIAPRNRWPRLAALRQRLEADPGVIYASALESGEEAKGSGACRAHLTLAEATDLIGRKAA